MIFNGSVTGSSPEDLKDRAHIMARRFFQHENFRLRFGVVRPRAHDTYFDGMPAGSDKWAYELDFSAEEDETP
jgi:hypothetical protein